MPKAKKILHDERFKTYAEIAKQYSLPIAVVKYRLNNGIDLLAPIKKGNKSGNGGRTSLIFEVDGKTMTTKELADKLGISTNALVKRKNRGVDVLGVAKSIGGKIKYYEYNGESLTYKGIAKLANLSERTTRDYLGRGKTAYDIIDKPNHCLKLVEQINNLPIEQRKEIVSKINL